MTNCAILNNKIATVSSGYTMTYGIACAGPGSTTGIIQGNTIYGATVAPITANAPTQVPPAQLTGWGSPTGAGVINNFPGASASLEQTSETVAQIIITLQALGIYGA